MNLPRNWNRSQRIEAGKLAIEKIKLKTKSGTSAAGIRFPQYSTSYKNSRDFKTAGKSSIVNLKLSGEMMSNIIILGEGEGFVTIGFEMGTEENNKAQYAVNSDNGPSRKFLGLKAEELQEIINTVNSNTRQGNIEALIAEGLVKNLFGVSDE